MVKKVLHSLCFVNGLYSIIAFQTLIKRLINFVEKKDESHYYYGENHING